MRKVKSKLPLNYVTVRVTKSRISKGLLAIPVSLIDFFPKNTSGIYLLNEDAKVERKTFIPYNSSSKECRIGGLKSFYDKYNVISGDELVVQLFDDDKYRIIPEGLFQNTLRSQILDFEQSNNEEEIQKNLSKISHLTNLRQIDILRNKFVFQSRQRMNKRKIIKKAKTTIRENIPYWIRKILLELYSGKCQITNFTFLTKTYQPYFEVHHIDPEKGNHFKNLLVVSPNIHAQFTHSHLKQNFDNDGWLRRVKFNQDEFEVFQIIDSLDINFEKEIHF